MTWIASTLCAVGMGWIAIQALRQKDKHPIVRDSFFLPLYFAGILQWVLWGIRIEDPALIIPSAAQLVLLSPTLFRWYRFRVRS